MKPLVQLHTIDNVLKNLTDCIGYCMASRDSHLNEIIFHYYLLTTQSMRDSLSLNGTRIKNDLNVNATERSTNFLNSKKYWVPINTDFAYLLSSLV